MKYSKSNLLMAIGQLLNQYRELKNNLRVFFIGNIDYEEKTEMENTIISFAMQKNFIFKDWVNYKKLLKIQRSADLLLLIKGSKRNTEVVIPGKIFEYIISGRPILALVPDGAARDLIMETNTGICVYPNDVEGIKNAILALYHKWENNQLKIEPNYEAIKKYDRKNLTKKLAAILDETLNKK